MFFRSVVHIDEALKNAEYGLSNYAPKNGIEEIIEGKQTALVKSDKGSREEMMVLIKAAPDACFENAVRLDEMAIDRVKGYALIEITADE